jgi:hypothetical protein
MNKTWQLRGLTALLALGWLASACAREANTLEEEEGGVESGTAGSGGSASPAPGGGKASGGKTASSTNAFGGTNAKGGSGGKPAGSSGAGGHAGSTGGGSGGSAGAAQAGSGGSSSGGATSVPPDVLARASAVVYYQTSHTMPSDGTIQMKLHVVNRGSDPLPVANLSIRYWFTAEATPELHQYYHGPAYADDNASFVEAGENSYALMTFSGDGALTKGQDMNASEVQLEITNNAAKFDQSDDYSWTPSASSSAPNDKLTLYLDDELIWGCEPNGACFDDGSAGAGGSSGGGAP